MGLKLYTKSQSLRSNPKKLVRVLRKLAEEAKGYSSGGRRSSTSESAPRGDTGANPVAARPKEDDA